MLYGVARVSTGRQSIERQIRNIIKEYPKAKIIQETYTGTKLEGIKEPHINTDVYKRALENQIKIRLETGNKATDDLINTIIEALNKFTIELAKEQIRIAFDKAQAEVDKLHQRTKEGILTAKLNGKKVGRVEGVKVETKKSIAAKEIILKHSKSFDGTLDDDECRKLTGVSRNAYYKYKRELKEDVA